MTTISRPPSGAQPPNMPETHYVDNRIFTDQTIFDEERERIFKKVWNFVCLETEVERPGDYRVVTVAGYPIIIVRGQDGQVRGFHNVCRHRGAEIVRDECGSRKSFQCFYHLWTYALDGRLTGVTLPNEFEPSGFRKEEFGLLEVRVDTAFGFVFVCLSDETESLDSFLGPMKEHLLVPFGQQKLELFNHSRRIVKTNWKLWWDNNTESYHNFLHPFNRKTSTFANRHWQIYPQGHSVLLPDTRESVTHHMSKGGLEDRTEYPWPGLIGNQMYRGYLFPDVMLNIRTTVLRIDHLIPISPGETMVEYRGIALADDTPEARATRLNHHNQLWAPFGRNVPEDAAAVESQWRAIKTGAIRYSIYAREADMQSDDDIVSREYYARWGAIMGRKASDPFGDRV